VGGFSGKKGGIAATNSYVDIILYLCIDRLFIASNRVLCCCYNRVFKYYWVLWLQIKVGWRRNSAFSSVL